MRIFIHTLTGKIFPLEAESFDTIDYIKGLIKEKEGVYQSGQRLVFTGRKLKGSKTLADYYIQNDSTVQMMLKLGVRLSIHIKTTSSGKPFTVALPLSSEPTVNDVKAEIEERIGVPVNEQRLLFSGKELDEKYRVREGSILRLVRLRDDDDVVDIAVVKAHKKAALSKDKGIVNPEVTEVGSKRARVDSSSAKGLSSFGAIRVQGMESFWDEEDFGLVWRRSRSLISPYDLNMFESKSHRTLIESVANDCVRTLNVATFLENQLQEYQDKLGHAEREVKRLTKRNVRLRKRNAYVEDSLQKKEKILKKVTRELDVECSMGSSFLDSEDRRRHIVSLERQATKSGVDDFKKSTAFKELVMDRAMSVYEDTVKECQRFLRETGRVSEDIIQLISPQNEEEMLHKEEQEDDDNEEEREVDAEEEEKRDDDEMTDDDDDDNEEEEERDDDDNEEKADDDDDNDNDNEVDAEEEEKRDDDDDDDNDNQEEEERDDDDNEEVDDDDDDEEDD